MKYKEIKIFSHPRSGSNYLAQIINLNFAKKGDYTEIYGDHSLPKDKVKNNPEIGFIYIRRNFDDVSKSVFKMKERFGLDVSNYNKFLSVNYNEIYNNKLLSYIEVKTPTGIRVETKISRYFADKKMTPKKFHQYHINSWSQQKKYTNFIEIQYEDLLNDFNGIMKNIASFLGSQCNELINIEERVGYIPPEKNLKRALMNAYNILFLKPLKLIKKIAKKILIKK